ncbi:MAG: BatA domain-containing protein [Flavobacteriaceae bacterium]
MHFKYPEILYFLFLLIIPIIVHLFQLRKFQKEYFTNVKFLKELDIKTRKSSQLKKWLLLFTRLFLLAFIILAFAQPFFNAKDVQGKHNELFVVLDNSYSMQAKGKQGELLKRSVQELLENIPEEQNFTLLTPDNSFYDTDIRSIQKDLQNLGYSTTPFSIENEMAKIKTLKPNKGKDIIIITDGKSLKAQDLQALDQDYNIILSVPKAENTHNVSVDSVYIHQVLDDFYELKVRISEYGTNKIETSVALYDQQELVAKTLLPEGQNEIIFTVPKEDFNGYVSVEDNSLEYDNYYFFSISKPEKTKVTVIGTEAKNEFLTRIYTEDHFELTNFELKTLDYNTIESQHTVVLNELEEIPQSLIVTLKAFVENGGNVVVIPSEKTTAQNLTDFASQFGNVVFEPIQNSKKMVTKITFEHPVFRNVFEKKTDNFQYPNVNHSFTIKGNIPSVLSYEDGSVFLTEIKKDISSLYLFSAPINKQNSNFQNSPLVVLSFYNMAQNQNSSGVISQFIADENPFFVEVNLAKEEILKVKNQTEEFIPSQQIFNQKVQLNFNEYPNSAGNFGIYKNDELLTYIGFNYNRTESDLTQDNSSILSDFTQKNIESIFSDLQSERTDNTVWKWFVLLGLLFLIIEILIQKFVK